jgi:hypothetical protein
MHRRLTVANQIIMAWLRQEKLTGDVHLLDGYFDIKVGEESSRKPFADRTYAKMVGEFARLARANDTAALLVMRLDQKPQPVGMKLDPPAAKLLREDPVLYIKSTDPPPRRVKLTLTDDAKPNKVKENLHAEVHSEPWQNNSPIPGGYDTVAEAFGDDIYCRVSGNLIECPSCGRWAASKPTEEGEADVECASCLFRDVFSLTVTSKRTWAIIPTEALLQNKTRRHRIFIPRLWNKGGPWIEYEQLKQRYETFCKERDNASECD